MPNFKITIEYDGRRYHGWQRQKQEPTIQAKIESALSVMTRRKMAVASAGRTDAGVHALGQTATFNCDTHITPDKFMHGLNGLLPNDIVIRACRIVPDSFHARYDAKSKMYRYHILNHPIASAIGRQYAWHIRQPLCVQAMTKALRFIVGRHDFKSFEGAGSPRASTVRTILKAEISTPQDQIVLNIEGDGFLRFMVRNIVGTIVEVGQKKRAPNMVKDILSARNRDLAGITAPPNGLFLVRVTYAKEIFQHPPGQQEDAVI